MDSTWKSRRGRQKEEDKGGESMRRGGYWVACAVSRAAPTAITIIFLFHRVSARAGCIDNICNISRLIRGYRASRHRPPRPTICFYVILCILRPSNPSNWGISVWLFCSGVCSFLDVLIRRRLHKNLYRVSGCFFFLGKNYFPVRLDTLKAPTVYTTAQPGSGTLGFLSFGFLGSRLCVHFRFGPETIPKFSLPSLNQNG